MFIRNGQTINVVVSNCQPRNMAVRYFRWQLEAIEIDAFSFGQFINKRLSLVFIDHNCSEVMSVIHQLLVIMSNILDLLWLVVESLLSVVNSDRHGSAKDNDQYWGHIRPYANNTNYLYPFSLSREREREREIYIGV